MTRNDARCKAKKLIGRRVNTGVSITVDVHAAELRKQTHRLGLIKKKKKKSLSLEEENKTALLRTTKAFQ